MQICHLNHHVKLRLQFPSISSNRVGKLKGRDLGEFIPIITYYYLNKKAPVKSK